MRAFGLLCLLAGSLVLIWPMVNGFLGRSFWIEHGTIVGGGLLCAGVIAVALSRPRNA